ncbi:MAG: efflux transporter outer membrane subunit [Rikenellaceae bacterium]
MREVIYILFISLGISCSPKLQSPVVELPEEYTYCDDCSAEGYPIEERWWEIFDNAKLNEAVQIALDNNRDLAAALANVEAARNHVRVAKAEFLPSLYFGAEVEAYRINGETTQEYSATPAIKWELSLFGKLRNSRNAAIAEYLSKEWGYRAAILSLTADVLTTIFTLNQYQQSYQIAQRSYQLRREATALVDSMYRYGMSDGVVLQQALSMVFSAQSEMVKYQRAVAQTQLALNLLLGQNSSYELPDFSFGHTSLPSVPVGIPSDLLERRPDVMESYYAVSSAAYDVGVARASRFPSFTLTADGGFVIETLKDLSSAKPIGWSIVGELTQPIFNFGALKSSEQVYTQEYIAAMNSYEQSILSALSDVETSLVDISTYRQELLLAHSLVEANAKIAESTAALYARGLGNYLSVIDAQRELYASQIDYQELLTQQYINYVSLVKSLGGGF